jgi:hypothetical protein
MKKILSIIILLGLFTTAKAQHCGWCGCSVIVLDVRESLTNEIIYDLDIILTDSTGKPYTSEWNLRNYKRTLIYQNTDTLIFGQNNKIADSEVDNIPFGIDRYMLLVYGNYPNLFESETDKIFIKDPKGRYESISIILDQNKVGSMCTSSTIRRDEDVLNAKTIKVKLKKKG